MGEEGITHSSDPENEPEKATQIRELGAVMLIAAELNAKIRDMGPSDAMAALMHAAASIAATRDKEGWESFEAIAKRYVDLYRDQPEKWRTH